MEIKRRPVLVDLVKQDAERRLLGGKRRQNVEAQAVRLARHRQGGVFANKLDKARKVLESKLKRHGKGKGGRMGRVDAGRPRLAHARSSTMRLRKIPMPSASISITSPARMNTGGF